MLTKYLTRQGWGLTESQGGGNRILCEFESRFPLVVKCGISLIDYDPIFENFLSLFF